jgi:hypothetical protein
MESFNYSFHCHICKKLSPEGKTFEEAKNLALSNGWKISNKDSLFFNIRTTCPDCIKSNKVLFLENAKIVKFDKEDFILTPGENINDN